MTAQPLTAEAVAQTFHEAYERLAPAFGYETRKASAAPWADVPEPNRSLMVAVAGEVLATVLDFLTEVRAARAANAELEGLDVLTQLRADIIEMDALGGHWDNVWTDTRGMLSDWHECGPSRATVLAAIDRRMAALASQAEPGGAG